MAPPPPRIVTLVLVDPRGTVLGQLPPLEVAEPRWFDVQPVVQAALARDGLKVTILRLLKGEGRSTNSGPVTYLAQVDVGTRQQAIQPWAGTLPEHSLRRRYARPGGPDADLAWVREVLQARQESLIGDPTQVRTWSLSSLWQMHTTLGPLWLKVVPPFFAHEGRMLGVLAGAPVPRVLAQDGGRMLLEHVDGEDRDFADQRECLEMIDTLVRIQAAWLGRADELIALGLPDWRAPALTTAIESFVARRTCLLAPDDQVELDRFAAGLSARFAEVAGCGIPDGLVHGDFHAGNVRSFGHRPVILDWGDCGAGHPMLDPPPFLHRMSLQGRDVVAAWRHWVDAWKQILPETDPGRAALLLEPVATTRLAMLSQQFIDASEPVEHAYHRRGVTAWLGLTVERLRAEERAVRD
jgi:Ser/Thr protein kinase RdoA (MazF antagonist)